MSDITILMFQVSFFILFLVLLIPYIQKRIKKRQLAYIENYTFPTKIALQVKKTYPHLSDLDIQKVLKGLRDYFYISNLSSSGETVGMPSQVVDVAWHEFILFTREYQEFCKKAFGKFHHHIPAEAMKSKDDAQLSLRIAWLYACKKDYIYPPQAKKLPLLFAIDTILNIEDGFKYTIDCNDTTAYCVKHIGSTGKGGKSSWGGGGCGGASCGGCGG